jgi:hypothetical protein
MRISFIFLLFSLIVLFSSCNSSSSQKEKIAEEDQAFVDADRAKKHKEFHKIKLHQVVPNWTMHWSQFIPDLSSDDFSLSFEIQLPDNDYQDFNLATIHPKLQSSFIADGKKKSYLDLYSYLIEPVERGSSFIAALNTDTEVRLLTEDKLQAKRLLFLGPSERAEDAVFFPDGAIIIVGNTEQIDGTAPFIWYIKEGIVQGWLCNTNALYDNVSYLQKVFPEFNF